MLTIRERDSIYFVKDKTEIHLHVHTRLSGMNVVVSALTF